MSETTQAERPGTAVALVIAGHEEEDAAKYGLPVDEYLKGLKEGRDFEHEAELAAKAVAAAARKRGEDFKALSLERVLEAEEEAGGLERGGSYVRTGWPLFDARTSGGFETGTLNVLGGGPGCGKSTWAQLVAEQFAEAPHGGIAYYLDIENGRRRFLRHMVGRRAGVSFRQVTDALRPGAPRDNGRIIERWQNAKAEVERVLGRRLFLEFVPPSPADLESRILAARGEALHAAPVLVVIDSLQKLQMRLDERRAGIDGWVRLIERLRLQHDVTVLVVSEITRAPGGEGFKTGMTSFKESGSIEYSAEIAMTLVRDDDEDPQSPSTLQIVKARESENGAVGRVASYRPVFPHYGLEEIPPASTPKQALSQAPAQRSYLPEDD